MLTGIHYGSSLASSSSSNNISSLYTNMEENVSSIVDYVIVSYKKNFSSMSNSSFLENNKSQVSEIDKKWDTLLANSEDFLAELADEALIEYRSGKTELLD